MKFIIKLIKNLIRRYFDHDVGQSGGQIAYFSLLSVFPFIVYMNTLLAYINVSATHLMSFVSSLLPPEISDFLDIYLADIRLAHTPGIVMLSIVATVYSASRVVRSFETAINRAYGTHEKRNFLHGIITSLLFTVCLAVTVVASIILTAAGENLVMYILSFQNVPLPTLRHIMVLKWIFTCVILFLAVSSFYYYMPIKKVSYKSVIPGTATTITGIAVFSIIFNTYIKFTAGFSLIYSSIGAVFILIFWLYFAGVILVMGAEINCAINELHQLQKQQKIPSGKSS